MQFGENPLYITVDSVLAFSFYLDSFIIETYVSAASCNYMQFENQSNFLYHAAFYCTLLSAYTDKFYTGLYSDHRAVCPLPATKEGHRDASKQPGVFAG